MSNLLPSFVSNTPPPITTSNCNESDTEDDDFGDFRTAGDLFSDDDLSSGKFNKTSSEFCVDITSNSGDCINRPNDPKHSCDTNLVVCNKDVCDISTNMISNETLTNHVNVSNVERNDQENKLECIEYEDDDFGDFVTVHNAQSKVDSADDFAVFTSHSYSEKDTTNHKNQNSSVVDLRERCNRAKQIFMKTALIIQRPTFNNDDPVTTKYSIDSDPIFTQLKDITNTPALHYQWITSQSKDLLASVVSDDCSSIAHLWPELYKQHIDQSYLNRCKDVAQPSKVKPLKETHIFNDGDGQRSEENTPKLQVTLLPYDYPPKTYKVYDGNCEETISTVSSSYCSIPVEPLVPKKVLLQPVQCDSIKNDVVIKWPEPGVNDDDEKLRHIELTYSQKMNDDWSEFVSKTTSPKRTPTPDLPLSVLNLSSIQPQKQSAPTITPSGLIQQQINTHPNVVQTSASNSPVLLSPQKQRTQPSLISEEYSLQTDDQDWGEFMSSSTLPSTSTFPTSIAKPNIITNPTYIPFMAPPKTTVKHQQPTSKKTSSLFSLPDLDFISWRDKLSTKKTRRK